MITIVKETITPEVAKEYLATNDGNRRLSMRIAGQLASEIREGRWQLTHQGIAFDENGVLIDGQHRLTAIVLAGVPAEMMVARGVKPSENNLYAIDNGRRRSIRDMLQIGKYDGLYTNSQLIGALQTFFIIKGRRGKDHRLSADEMAKYIGANEAGARVLNSFIHMVKQSGKVANSKVYAALYSAFLGGESEESIKSFLRCYARNEIDPRYYSKAALDLADHLAKRKMNEEETVARVENAVYCYLHNIKRSNMTQERYKAKSTWFFPVRVDKV
jgi:hypothetical protein